MLRKQAVVVVMAGLALAGCSGTTRKASGPGPTKVVAGVPVGYAHTKDGAGRAALTYEGALSDLSVRADGSWENAVKVIVIPTRFDEAVKAMKEAQAFYAQHFGSEGVGRSAVLGYRVKGYDPAEAEVELWGVSVVGRPETVPPRAGWSTRTIRLRWLDDDWKVAWPPESVAGPTPALEGTASDPAAVIGAARELEGVRYVPAR